MLTLANPMAGQSRHTQFRESAFLSSNPGTPATQSCYFSMSGDFTEKSRHSSRYLAPTGSLAPTDSHFRVEKRESRRVVSVRNFPASRLGTNVSAGAALHQFYRLPLKNSGTILRTSHSNHKAAITQSRGMQEGRHHVQANRSHLWRSSNDRRIRRVLRRSCECQRTAIRKTVRNKRTSSNEQSLKTRSVATFSRPVSIISSSCNPRMWSAPRTRTEPSSS
jgi:hypothetical protein